MADEKSCESCGSDCGSAGGREKEKFNKDDKARDRDGNVVEYNLAGAVDRREYARSLGRIHHKVVVMSCKGGVGKSTVAVNLALSLAMAGRKVGLLDVDLHGPSVPKMLNMEGTIMKSAGNIIMAADYENLLKVVSLGFMLGHKDDAVIWRGPSKISVLQQFLRDVEWGTLDYLVIDAPPGTGDEPLTICQLIPDIDGAVIVTTPQEVALADVRKSVTFCRKINLPIIGVVENMSNPSCPHCGKEVEMFGCGGGEKMAADMGVPFLGRVPMDPAVLRSGDLGKPFVYDDPGSEAYIAFSRIMRPVLKLKDTKEKPDLEGYRDPVGGGEV